MSLADAAASHFETLTQRTFYVVDTEYTNAPDGNHIISISGSVTARGEPALRRPGVRPGTGGFR